VNKVLLFLLYITVIPFNKLLQRNYHSLNCFSKTTSNGDDDEPEVILDGQASLDSILAKVRKYP